MLSDSCADVPAGHCLTRGMQAIYDGRAPVAGKKPEERKERTEEHIRAYKLGEPARLAARQRLQARAGQEPAVGHAFEEEAIAFGEPSLCLTAASGVMYHKIKSARPLI